LIAILTFVPLPNTRSSNQELVPHSDFTALSENDSLPEDGVLMVSRRNFSYRSRFKAVNL